MTRPASRARILAVAGFALAACDHSRAHPDASPNAAPSPSLAPAASAPIAPASALPPLVGEGCHAGVDLSGDAVAALARVAAACMPGSVASPAPALVALDKAVRFHLATGAICLRIAALAPAEFGNLELVISDSGGHEIARDTLPGRVALIGEKGPVCLKSAGDYDVTARAPRGNAPVALGVWRTSAD